MLCIDIYSDISIYVYASIKNVYNLYDMYQ